MSQATKHIGLNTGNRILTTILKYKMFYLMVLPLLLFYIIFCYIPMYGLKIVFQDFRPLLGFIDSRWVGLDNFKEVISDMYFWRAFRNTCIIAFYKLLICFPIPIIMAIFLNEIMNLKFKKIVQTIIYLPRFISWIIISGMLGAFLSPDNGFINTVLINLGFINEGIYFQTQPEFYRGIVVITDVWKSAGWGTIIYFATISGINPELYEAAIIDGANRFHKMRYITVPELMPTISLLLILTIGSFLSNAGFEQIYMTYNTLVFETGDILDTFVFRNGIGMAKFSYSATAGLIKSVISAFLIIMADRVAKKTGNAGLF